MRSLLLVLIGAILLGGGCSGPGEKGVNKDKDKPRPAETGK